MTSKRQSQLYYIRPVIGEPIDNDFLLNGHDATKIYVLIPVLELYEDGKKFIGCKVNTYDGVLNFYEAQIDSDINDRLRVVIVELAKKAIFAELAIICDVNPIQFVCSCECQKKAIIKAFSGYEGFDAKKSFINLE